MLELVPNMECNPDKEAKNVGSRTVMRLYIHKHIQIHMHIHLFLYIEMEGRVSDKEQRS